MVGKKNNKRDVAWLGDCDDGVQALADKVGLGVSSNHAQAFSWNKKEFWWFEFFFPIQDELRALVAREHKRIDEANEKEEAAKNKDKETKTEATEAAQTKSIENENDDNKPKL